MGIGVRVLMRAMAVAGLLCGTVAAAPQTTGPVHRGLPVVDWSKAGSLDTSGLPMGKAGEPVVAVVGSRELTLTDFDREMAAAFASRSITDDNQKTAYRLAFADQALDRLIRQVFMEVAAEKAGIEVTDADITAAIQEQNEQLPAGRKLQDVARSTGLSMEEIRRDTARTLLESRLLARYALAQPDPPVADLPAASRASAATTGSAPCPRVSHIFVAKPADDATSSAARSKADAALAAVKAGEDFASVARRESGHPVTAARGGDAGIIAAAMPGAGLFSPTFSMKTGEISAVVESPGGFTIFKVDDAAPERGCERAALRVSRAQAALEKELEALRRRIPARRHLKALR